MTAKKAIFYFLFFALSPVVCFAQMNFDYTEGKFYIKGIVIDVETRKPIPLANIHLVNTNKGTTCDNDGAFTLLVSKKDTLKFTSVGYISKTINISDLDSTKYYVLEIQLLHDFVKLNAPTIYPYQNIDEFKKAFVNAKEVNKLSIYGIAPPKYSNQIPAAKLSNPITFLYEKMKHRRAADPDFKP